MIFPRFSLLVSLSLSLSGVALPVAAQGTAIPSPEAGAFRPHLFQRNDLVVLLGDTFFERDGQEGYLESALTMALAGQGIRTRNMGWSGDTPRCESRSYFGPPQEGMDRLRAQLAELKPTLLIMSYGAVDAFKGKAGHADFLAALDRLTVLIRESCGARMVIMSPPPVGPHAALEGHAARLLALEQAMQEWAQAQGHSFVPWTSAAGFVPVSVNGVTWTDADYQKAVPSFLKALNLSLPAMDVETAGKVRAAVVEKHRLFFHRWRPQNEIYLFGSRKHEQGNNGAEIPQFDPLIAQKEAAIAALLQPVKQ